MAFIPDETQVSDVDVPFFEDVTGADVPGRRVKQPLKVYRNRVTEMLLKLGAGNVRFTPGKMDTICERFGYRIEFVLNGNPARMEVAALPLRDYSDKKKDRALAQCLYLVGNWLEAEVYSSIYRTNSMSLVPYVITARGTTVIEELVAAKVLPAGVLAGRLLPGGK